MIVVSSESGDVELLESDGMMNQGDQPSSSSTLAVCTDDRVVAKVWITCRGGEL